MRCDGLECGELILPGQEDLEGMAAEQHHIEGLVEADGPPVALDPTHPVAAGS
ncbi:hypothetical protein D3C86_2118280 [compost metagenome]